MKVLTIQNSQRNSYVDDVWRMYSKSYGDIGMHLLGPEELFDYEVWEIWFEDRSPIAFNLYRVTPFGLKSGLSGTDGSALGKTALKNHIKTRFDKPGNYAEVSGAVERLSAGAPVVCATEVDKVLRKQVISSSDGVHYQRPIGALGLKTKKLIGRPQGVMSGPEEMCAAMPLSARDRSRRRRKRDPNPTRRLTLEEREDMAEHLGSSSLSARSRDAERYRGRGVFGASLYSEVRKVAQREFGPIAAIEDLGTFIGKKGTPFQGQEYRQFRARSRSGSTHLIAWNGSDWFVK